MNSIRIIRAVIVVTMLFSFSSCEKDTNLATEKAEPYLDSDMQLAGKRHNEGVSYILKQLEEEGIDEKSYGVRTKGQSFSDSEKIKLLRLIDEKAKEFLKEHSLTYQGVEIEFIDYDFTDKQLLELYDAGMKTRSSNEKSKYFEEITVAYKNTSNVDNDIDAVLSRATLNIKREQELIPILLSGSVLKYSNRYWDNPKTRSGRIGIALADSAGAYDGAMCGLVAGGPVGAVVVGVNGALIASSMAFLWGELW